VACIIGEISSASALTISQVAERTRTLFINTGANSDELRGKGCKRFMFHIESQNSMYVKTAGRALLARGLVKGKKWFSLTADYAFGHDLLRVAKRFMAANGGDFAADKLVPTDATDFSPLLLEIRSAKPDLVISNLAGNQITNFLKQYTEFGLTFPVAGFGFDTALAWGAGKGNFLGTWPVVWHHLIETPATRKFVADFTKRYSRPPENQAWGDYNAMKLTAQAMIETRSLDSAKLVEHFERGAKFGLMKTRDGYFRKADHQMMHEMYTVTALPVAQIRNEYDIFTSSAPVPGPSEPLEAIASTAEENECRMV
ncbi:MAG: ABC transporter substrate-binding protein, partial [Usitatibacter sp.]